MSRAYSAYSAGNLPLMPGCGRLRKRNLKYAKSRALLALGGAERRVSRRSGGSNLVEQVGVTIQQLEQFDQSQRRLGLAILIARESVDSNGNFGGSGLHPHS